MSACKKQAAAGFMVTKPNTSTQASVLEGGLHFDLWVYIVTGPVMIGA